IGKLSLQYAASGFRVLGDRLGNAEVDDFDVTVVGYQDVLWAHVAVNDPQGFSGLVGLAMCVLETRTGSRRDERRNFRRKGDFLFFRALEDRAQVLAMHVLHGDEVV